MASWILLCVATIAALAQVIAFDYREHPVQGDQASFLLQALSLAGDGHNLSYDAQDLEDWRDLEWSHDPHGLFYQRNSTGYAFAKPYGVSLYLAAPIAVLGPRWGVAVAQSGLLLGTVALCIALLRLRLRGPVVPLVTTAFVFGSAVWWYSFVIMTELFLLCVVGAAIYSLLRSDHGDWRWALLGFALTGFVYTEKAPALLVLGPLCLVALVRARGWRRRSSLAAVAAVVAAVSMLPYLHASDFESRSPYGGERYYARGHLPFDDEPGEPDVKRSVSGDRETFSFALERAFVNVPAKVRSLYYSVVGRRTGVLPFMPLAVLVGAGIVYVSARERRLDLHSAVLVVGGCAYLSFYAWVFTYNYFGGAQSVGNRYWVQVSIVVVAAAATSRLSARVLSVMAGVAIVTSLALTPHHQGRAQEAYVEYWDTSALQDLLPLEKGTLSEEPAPGEP